MPFISDPIGNRTHDPDPNIELVKRYSQLTGSSGYQEYAIEWSGRGGRLLG